MPRLYLLLLCTTILVSGCFFHARTAPIPLSKNSVKAKASVSAKHSVQRNVSSFSQLQIEGTIDASVHSGYKKSLVILRGDPRDLQQVVTKVENDTLLVSMGEGYPQFGAVNAEIRSRYLNSIAYKGAGKLSGTKLKSNDLTLDIDNEGISNLGGYLMLRKLTAKGKGLVKISGVHSHDLAVVVDDTAQVTINGMASLRSLDLNGSGRFTMYWVKGPWLKIRAHGHPQVQLAGVVDKLDVELHDEALFEGRYLRAKRAFVKTFDKAVAKISAVKRQHTLASDSSDIYFYNVSDMRTDFMAYNGSVLDMRSTDIPHREAYTSLNAWH